MPDDAPKSADDLFPAVYSELRELADRFFHRHQSGQTLQPTALVHEVYLKLMNQTPIPDRATFLGVAASAMRQVLIDRARARNAQKRGGDWQSVTLDGPGAEPGVAPLDVLALDEALERLTAVDERRARVVELRFFGGLTIEEAAETLAVSSRTVELDWKFAKAWLSQALSDGDPS